MLEVADIFRRYGKAYLDAFGDAMLPSHHRAFQYILHCRTPAMGGHGAAPPALAYLTAGIGFCFMTQLGRYATIVKQDLPSYRIVQDNIFNLNGDLSDWSATITNDDVDTHVFVDFEAGDEAGEQLGKMGQQTCFLHAAMAASYPTNLTAKVNGQDVTL